MKTLFFIFVISLITTVSYAKKDSGWVRSGINGEKINSQGEVIGHVDDDSSEEDKSLKYQEKTTVSSEVERCEGGSFLPDQLGRCIGIRFAAAIAKQNQVKPDNQSTKDKAITCKLRSSTNQDWEACLEGIKTYNTLLGLESAMKLSTGVQSKLAQDKIQKETTEQAQAGNLQTAALQATADQNLANARLLDQQATYYGGQAGYLQGLVYKWPSKAKSVCSSKKLDELKKGIATSINGAITIAKGKLGQQSSGAGSINVAGVNFGTLDKPNVEKEITETNCIKILSLFNKSELFPNSGAMSALQTKAIESAAKAGVAILDAKRLRRNAEIAAGIKDQFVDPGGEAMFDLCKVDPANIQCRSNGIRVNQPGYQAGQFNLDGGGNGQAFNLNPNAGTGEEIGNIGTGEATNIAGVTSPFADEADKASDLLDQAGGASYTSAGAGGGGGGGVGGGGGGGSAALGGDLQGAEKDDKEAEIKASKRDGGYASGGGGFQATGSGSSDENPLQSLFDQDGAKGGIEEDRSIASEDIDNSNSALFEKISKKYAKVHGEKRIEANNLE